MVNICKGSFWKSLFLPIVLLSLVIPLHTATSRVSDKQLLAAPEIVNVRKKALITGDATLTIVAVGDIMMGSTYPSSDYLPPKHKRLLQPLYTILNDADLTFANLEGPVLNSGGKVKQCSDPAKCFAFRQPESCLEQFREAGVDMFSLANNHTNDFGSEGRDNTCKVLRERGFYFAGLEKCPWDTVTVKGVRIGLTAFAPTRGCLQINDYNLVRQIVTKLKKMCDVVIVSFHGGAEGSAHSHVTKNKEIFYGENRGNVYEFARIAIDAGADVVLGHGPHVTRAIDCYKGRFIAYSMGNFCTYRQFNLKGLNGIAPLFKLRIKRDGTFIDGRVISIKQLDDGGPVIDEQNRANEQIKALTASDLPELPVNFGENGFFNFTKASTYKPHVR
ncbi:MAG: CapA family protein [Pelodictyon phaeoclathratiforme]|uniref:CapA family protein n=1 Tax=Pelodictyon phaeoclathratiforme (strain DSM 5477 / BU-1) TaxID=324925 RepID=B4SF81_PELPB|nr:CapA family protein [Pelodictyon phaeoclathratiforme BU-1]MBV5288914.1 CapA family protein [Pelodictyon phaeoclathratiforme]